MANRSPVWLKAKVSMPITPKWARVDSCVHVAVFHNVTTVVRAFETVLSATASVLPAGSAATSMPSPGTPTVTVRTTWPVEMSTTRNVPVWVPSTISEPSATKAMP